MSLATIDDAIELAIEHQQAGRLTEAEEIYWQVLAQQPERAEVLHLLGLIAKATEQITAAIDLLDRAVAADPAYTEAFADLGFVLFWDGQVDRAIEALSRATELQPDFFLAQLHLGNALKSAGRLDEAVAVYSKAIELSPDSPDAHNNLGAVFYQLKQFEPAIAEYQKAIDLKPDAYETYNNLAISLMARKTLDEAMAACNKAISLNPDFYDAHVTLAQILNDLHRLDESLSVCIKAANAWPNVAPIQSSLGNALAAVGRFDEGLVAHRRSIELQPDFAIGRWNYGLALLCHGDFDRGWAEYEWRWANEQFHRFARKFSQPRWDGQDLTGKTILLLKEQGHGDTIQFARYAALLAERGAKVLLDCQPPLYRLLNTAAGVSQAIAPGTLPPVFDYHCPLMSLPREFATRLESIPANVPYLHADLQLAETWAEKITAKSPGLKVGLVWAGSPTHAGDSRRSISLSQLAPLASAKGVRFFSLQKGEASRQSAAPPERMEILDFTADIDDFADTAAFIANLDLVVCVDTSVAHLAGALGKPTWVLLPFVPDWRWMLDRSDSPWYPTMRLYRQPHLGDWLTPIEAIAHDLQNLAAITPGQE